MEQLLAELVKAGLVGWLQYQRMKGKTDEEIKVLFETERAEVNQNNPVNLPDRNDWRITCQSMFLVKHQDAV
jgi:hypothetical protein